VHLVEHAARVVLLLAHDVAGAQYGACARQGHGPLARGAPPATGGAGWAPATGRRTTGHTRNRRCVRLTPYPAPTLCRAAHRRARARRPSRPAPPAACARRPSPPAPGRGRGRVIVRVFGSTVSRCIGGRAPRLVDLGLSLAAPRVVRIRGVAAVHVRAACGMRARHVASLDSQCAARKRARQSHGCQSRGARGRTHGGHEPRVDGVAVAADDCVLAVARAQRRGGHHACGRRPRSARAAQRARGRRGARRTPRAGASRGPSLCAAHRRWCSRRAAGRSRARQTPARTSPASGSSSPRWPRPRPARGAAALAPAAGGPHAPTGAVCA